MSKIKITLNGEEKFLAEKMTVAQLISDLELDITKIAVEKDLEIVGSNKFSEVLIDEGSRIEIVHFIGGG
jgi:thiamine biosynthesis protein ThiS